MGERHELHDHARAAHQWYGKVRRWEAATLELYHDNISVCAQKVRLVLAEKGTKATEHHLSLRDGDQQQPDYVKLNPEAVVPTLVHDGVMVTESTVIAEYLDEVFAERSLWPAYAGGRARGEEELQRIIDRTPDPERRARRRKMVDNGAKSMQFGDAIRVYDKPLTNLEKALAASPWFADEDYTLADVSITPYVNRLAMLKLERMWTNRPNVAAAIQAT